MDMARFLFCVVYLEVIDRYDQISIFFSNANGPQALPRRHNGGVIGDFLVTFIIVYIRLYSPIHVVTIIHQ